MSKTVLDKYSTLESVDTDSYADYFYSKLRENERYTKGPFNYLTNLYSFNDLEFIRKKESPLEVKYVINMGEQSSASTIKKATSFISSNYYDTILSIIKNDVFEDGELSKSQLFIESLNSTHEYNKVVSSLLCIYDDAFQMSDADQVFVGLLTMLSSRPFDDLILSNRGSVIHMLSSLFENEDVYLRDKVVQVFEKWNVKRFIPLLSEHNEEVKWLKKYIEEVIKYLEEGGID